VRLYFEHALMIMCFLGDRRDMRCDAIWHYAGAALGAKFIPWQHSNSAVQTVTVGGCEKDRLRDRWWVRWRRTSLQRLPIINAPTSTCDVRAMRSRTNSRTPHSERIANSRLREINAEQPQLHGFPQIPTQGWLPIPTGNEMILK
jgi:hypothetical protein